MPDQSEVQQSASCIDGYFSAHQMPVIASSSFTAHHLAVVALVVWGRGKDTGQDFSKSNRAGWVKAEEGRQRVLPAVQAGPGSARSASLSKFRGR